MIVAMKIGLRTEAEQSGEQSPQQDSSVNPPSPRQHRTADPISPWSLRSRNSNVLPPTQNLADRSLRRGAACCARSSAADQRYPLADARSMRAFADPLPYNVGSIPQHFAPKIAHFPHISTRNWSKSRSHTKQTTKPPLPGTRIGHCHSPESLNIHPKIHLPGAPHARTQRS